MVADLCRVPGDYVIAIETALGQQAQNIVTETQQAAKEAIDFLKRERRGRATFLPLDDIRGRERVPHEVVRERGVVGVASQLVEFDSAHREAFEFLLGNVLVIETLDDAIAIRRRHRPPCRLVTLDGEVINPGGAMTGGRQQGGEGGGLVSRKNEIRNLEEQLQELAERRLKTGTARDEAKKRAFAIAMDVEEARRAIQAGDRAVGEAKAQLAKVERDRIHCEQSASSFGSELEEIGAELAGIEAEQRDLSGQHVWFEALKGRLDVALEERQKVLAERAAARDRAQEAVAALRVSLATTQERQEAARNHLGHLVRSRQELEDHRAERQRRLAGHDAKRAELRHVREAGEAVFAEESVQVTALAEKLAALIGERDQLRNGVEEQRQEQRAVQSRLRSSEQERNRIEVALGEAKVRLEGITQRILDDFQLDLAEAFSNYQRPENLDLAVLRRDLDAAEKELAAIGPVNLAAIDELEEAQAREAFLDKQFTDLTSAATKLTEIIEHINDVSRKLFRDTFDQVANNFSELFRKLFGGGRAYLKLEDPPVAEGVDANGEPVKAKKQELDILEAGLEIYAQPPGKNPKVITQLSGGEKALTAIALLFAVYRTKPSPFCVLDEVDAPLDESNVDIYCNMVREFTKAGSGARTGGTAGEHRGSQFIVITHRKRTMQRADAIYGITQNEPGVSTKISVQFSEVGQFGDTEKPVAQAGNLAETTRGSGPFAG
jgi:chromosome segregation protein